MKTWLIYLGMVGIGLLALFGGCQWFSGEEELEPDDFLTGDPQFSSLEDVDPRIDPAPTPPAAQLILNLPEHQPLPLLKTVEQVLVQKTREGDRVSHSSLELAVTVQLEEKAPDGSQLLSVVYNRVRYSQDVAGKSFVFDSTVPSGQLPVEALPYKGLVGNGFSFWIGKDHRLQKAVGFAEFLKRCVREVPPAQQQQVLLAFSETAHDGVTNFVDDSIAFFPSHHEVQENATWNHERHLAKPISLVLNHRCTLKRMTEQLAEIEIEGTIAPTNPLAPPTSQIGDPLVIVRDGHTKGRCEIDCRTGLPVHAEIKQFLNMEVKLPDGRHFDQQKVTTTSIRQFPRTTSPTSSPVIHAGAEIPIDN